MEPTKKCEICSKPITKVSKYYPLKYRKFCSNGICHQKAWLIANRPTRIEQARRSHLKVKFGITIEEYEELYTKQNGACAICGVINKKYIDTKGRSRPSLYIDHSHASSEVRGLLCHGCNLGLGYFKDSPTNLQSAIAYLKPYEKA